MSNKIIVELWRRFPNGREQLVESNIRDADDWMEDVVKAMHKSYKAVIQNYHEKE